MTSEPLKRLQQLRDSQTSAKVLILEIKKLDRGLYAVTMLTQLHWILESLLKELLSNNHTLDSNIKKYHKKYKKTILRKEKILEAKKIRNDIAHSGLIYAPDKISLAIDKYIGYIYLLAHEREIDLDSFIPSKEFIEEEAEKKSIFQKRGFWAILVGTIILGFIFYMLFFNYNNFFTASKDGNYYRFAKSIKKEGDLDFNIKITEGSIDNMRKLGIYPEINRGFAFVQYDVLEEFSKEAQKGNPEAQKILNNIRVLKPIFKGKIHILTKANNQEIKTFKDIEDKIISIGELKSGTSLSAERLYRAFFHKEIQHQKCKSFANGLKALQEGIVDVLILGGGDSIIAKIKESDGVKFVPYNEQKSFKRYQRCQLKKSEYPWMKKDTIQTLCVDSFFITNILDSKDSELNYFIDHELHWKDKKLSKYLTPLPFNVLYHDSVRWRDYNSN